MARKIEGIDTDDLIHRHEAGESLEAAAHRLNVSRPLLYRRLAEVGFRARNQSEAMFVRMARTPRLERLRLVKRAHDAVRGKRQTDEHRVKIAQTRERTIRPTRTERKLIALLRRRSFSVVAQKAVGPYNIDVAITEPPIAVEVFGGRWHATGRHAARFRKRTDYLLNHGWHVIIIWVMRDYPLEVGAANEVVAFTKMLSSNPATQCQELVLRGDGKRCAAGHDQANGTPLIGCNGRRDNCTGRYASAWK